MEDTGPVFESSINFNVAPCLAKSNFGASFPSAMSDSTGHHASNSGNLYKVQMPRQDGHSTNSVPMESLSGLASSYHLPQNPWTWEPSMNSSQSGTSYSLLPLMQFSGSSPCASSPRIPSPLPPLRPSPPVSSASIPHPSPGGCHQYPPPISRPWTNLQSNSGEVQKQTLFRTQYEKSSLKCPQSSIQNDTCVQGLKYVQSSYLSQNPKVYLSDHPKHRHKTWKSMANPLQVPPSPSLSKSDAAREEQCVPTGIDHLSTGVQKVASVAHFPPVSSASLNALSHCPQVHMKKPEPTRSGFADHSTHGMPNPAPDMVQDIPLDLSVRSGKIEKMFSHHSRVSPSSVGNNLVRRLPLNVSTASAFPNMFRNYIAQMHSVSERRQDCSESARVQIQLDVHPRGVLHQVDCFTSKGEKTLHSNSSCKVEKPLHSNSSCKVEKTLLTNSSFKVEKTVHSNSSCAVEKTLLSTSHSPAFIKALISQGDSSTEKKILSSKIPSTKIKSCQKMPKENKKIGNAILNYGEKKSIPRKRKVKTQDAAECDKGISEIPVKKRKPSGGRQKSKKFTWENADKVIISQDETCAKLVKIFPEFPCCQDCADLIKRKSTSTYCRFIKFRKLHMMDDKLQPAGLFSLEDAKATSLEKQAQLWMPLKSESNGNGLSCEKATFYLKHVGDEFCKLLMQQISQMEETKDKKRAWKMVEEQVREMCDVCQTTIFNIHWVCEKCGFMACSDCFNDRKEGSAKMWLLDDEKARTMNKDIFSWMLCTDGSDHDIDELAQAHVIPSIEILRIMSTKLHSLRKEFHVSLDCPCMVKEEASSEANDRLCETREDGLIKEDTPAQETEIAKMGENPIMKHENEMEGKEKVMLSSCGKTLGLPALAIKNAFPLMKWENQTEENSDKEVSLFGKALGIPSRKVVESGEVPTKKQEFAFCTYLQRKGGTFQKEEDITDERDGDSVSSEDFVESMTQEFLGMLARPRNDQQQQASEQEEQMDCMDSGGKPSQHGSEYPRGKQPNNEKVESALMVCNTVSRMFPSVPHSWFCGGKLLCLDDPKHSGNQSMFQHQWLRGHPVIVSNVDHHLNMDLWTPASFCEEFGNQKHELVNCLTGRIVSGKKMKKFWAGFEDVNEQLQDTEGRKMLLKLKDWPPAMDFKDLLPSRFDDLMQALPLGEYTIREGVLNLSSRLPNIFVKPDLGPKMYIAYGSTVHPSVGTTNLHLDISDAVNVMVHTGIPEGVDREKVKQGALKALQEGGCDYLTLRRVREKGDIPGALWHIYHPEDADKIRDLLNRISVEKGKKISWQEDPIHDQATYLDTTLRNRLYYDYKVTGYAIAQCLGDAVFIPAGAPHQVQNLHNCIKVAEDFVSPENVTHCFHLTQEFRHLSDTHSNHEDKLQIKNILYHAMKDAISLLSS